MAARRAKQDLAQVPRAVFRAVPCPNQRSFKVDPSHLRIADEVGVERRRLLLYLKKAIDKMQAALARKVEKERNSTFIQRRTSKTW
jgi:hypothetical protein